MVDNVDGSILLPGFSRGTATIVIQYNVQPGIQTAEHPNPGV